MRQPGWQGRAAGVTSRARCHLARRRRERHVSSGRTPPRPPGAPGLDPDASAALRLFDALGLPSVAGARLVRLRLVERQARWVGDPRAGRAHERTAWLVGRTEGGGLELLTHELERLACRPVPGGCLALPRWLRRGGRRGALPAGCAEVGFEAWSSRLVTTSLERPDCSLERLRRVVCGRLPIHLEALLLARWSVERALQGHAAWLVAAARLALARGMGRDPPVAGAPSPTLLDAAREDLATHLRWQAIVAANEGAPRAALIERWSTIAEDLPATRWTDEAHRMVCAYRSLVDEDAAAPPADPGAPAALRAVHLVAALRDEAAVPRTPDGVPRLLLPRPGGHWQGPSAVPELVALGPAAVPALREGLEDERPSRCIHFEWETRPETYGLLTIGQCCAEVLAALRGGTSPSASAS